MGSFVLGGILALACTPTDAFFRTPYALRAPTHANSHSQHGSQSRLTKGLASLPNYGAFGDGDECASDNIFPPKEPLPLQSSLKSKESMLSPAGDNATPKSLDELKGLLGDLDGLEDDMAAGYEGLGGDMDLDALMAQLQGIQAGQAAEGQAFDQSYADQPGYVPEVPPPPSGKGDGYSWASDELRMLLRIPLPPNSKAKSVNVDVTPTTIKARLGDRVLLEGKLGGKCAPDDTFWVLDDDESDSAEEGSKVLAVDIERARGAPAWAQLLEGENDPLQAKVTDRVWFELAVNGTTMTDRIEFGLFGARCPKTVANFVALCRGDTPSTTRPGQLLSLRGSAFHRIIPGFMLQGGDITAGDGTGGESIYGAKFDDEDFSLGHATEGLLSMANSGPNTCGSQFFITTAPATWLDGKHTVVGRVLSGYSEVVVPAESCGSRGGDVSGTVTITDCGVVDEH